MKAWKVPHTFLSVGLFVLATSLSSGCFPVVPGGPGDGGGNGNGNGNGDTELIPAVRLSVSNPTPTLSEEVILTCELTNEVPGDVRFAFTPATSRLVVDDELGTARFVVSESDLNISIGFNCTGTNDFGASEASNRVNVTPTASPPLP